MSTIIEVPSVDAQDTLEETRKTKKKMSIICFSGDFDRSVAAFTLASGAAAMNYDVKMFFTFWGLNLMKNYWIFWKGNTPRYFLIHICLSFHPTSQFTGERSMLWANTQEM